MLGGGGCQPQERRDFFLNVDDGFGRSQLLGESLILLAQPRQLLLAGCPGRPSTPLGGEGGEQTAVSLLTPMRQMGGIEAFSAQQRPELPGLAGVRLPQDAYFVGRRELPTPGVLDDFRIRWARLGPHSGGGNGPVGCGHDPRSFSAHLH